MSDQEKNLFSSKDAAPAVLYALRSVNNSSAYPVLQNADGSLKTDPIGAWNKVTQTQTATTDVWTFEYAGSTTKTVTITYTDSTKATISTVEIT